MVEQVEAKRKASTAETSRSTLMLHIVPTLGSKKAEQVTSGDIARIHAKLKHIPYRRTEW